MRTMWRPAFTNWGLELFSQCAVEQSCVALDPLMVLDEGVANCRTIGGAGAGAGD